MHKYKCPHCGTATIVSDAQEIASTYLTCLNCNKTFAIKEVKMAKKIKEIAKTWTPGPWNVQKQGSKWLVENSFNVSVSSFSLEPDARVSAAAPELYQWLNDLVEDYVRIDDYRKDIRDLLDRTVKMDD